MSQTVTEIPEEKKSLRLYASHVFKKSSVSVVSAIASTRSIPRKVFRALVFILFTAGFLYQCITFFAYVLSDPTIVTIDIKRPTSYLHPAFTFCNYNRVKRSKFCSKYPDDCIEPSADFCETYPSYCSGNSSVPKEEFYHNPLSFDQAGIQDLSHNIEDLLVENYRTYPLSERPEGPLFRFRDDGNEENEVSACFSLFSRAYSQLDPIKKQVNGLFMDKEIVLHFDAEETEKFNPNSPSGVLFSIHSQYEKVNPYDSGIFLKPAYLYKIMVTMEEEKLLPYPYKSDCLNYTQKWLQNNRTGPRSQQVCEETCKDDLVFMCFGCALLDSTFSKTQRPCTNEDFFQACEAEDEPEQIFYKCYENCRDDCLKQKFSYQIKKRKATPTFRDGNVTKESRHIKVYIEVDESEMITLEYKPQYQEVEAFSYIGGFIGIWLGISLVQVFDFLESTFRIIAYFLRRGSTCAGKCCRA